MNKILQAANGHKKAVATGLGAVISMPFLISFLVNMNTTVVATETTVETHTKQIEKLEEIPAQIARIETNIARTEENIKDIKEDFIDFRGEQRICNTKTEGKLDKILDAVKK